MGGVCDEAQTPIECTPQEQYNPEENVETWKNLEKCEKAGQHSELLFLVIGQQAGQCA